MICWCQQERNLIRALGANNAAGKVRAEVLLYN